jgi:DNA-binding NarL/FixJ family response regulator
LRQVLVIDDHRQIREMTAQLLSGRFEVTVREDALSIVDDFELLEEPVVVLDISMPKLDGLSAARILKDRHPEARIVFFSSDPSPRKIAEASALGGCAYIVKTRGVADLVPAIQAAMEIPDASRRLGI